MNDPRDLDTKKRCINEGRRKKWGGGGGDEGKEEGVLIVS